MRTFVAAAVVALGVVGSTAYVSAQPYYGDGYRERRYEERDRGYRDGPRDEGRRSDRYDDRDRGRRGASFDEREYLRCNPDVRRAVSRGQFGGSGLNHYQEYGRRENRRLSC